jgi:hypothetical protein
MYMHVLSDMIMYMHVLRDIISLLCLFLCSILSVISKFANICIF